MSDNSHSEIKNGFYKLSYKEDGVYISAYPPENEGKKLEFKKVFEKLERKGIENIDVMLLERVIKESSKTPVKIAEPQKELLVDASVEVSVSPDEMRAYVTLVEPDGGREITANTIVEALDNEGIVYGIKDDVINSLEKHPIYNEMICVAEGVHPVDGKDGSIKYNFDITQQRKPRILDDGKVDFRELNLVKSVRKGEVLCVLVPPKQGEKGMTVNGKELKCKEGKPARIPRGRNVTVSEDGTELVAAIDGQIDYFESRINVFATHEVKADVDNSTGNIKFIGNVIVRGNVLSGFRVEAGGNVEVWGVVENATIHAGGDIILRRGIQGMGRGILTSDGDIVAKYIENSTVKAKRDIKSEAIMHSNVSCGHKLEIAGRKGLLVGGTCRVGKEIEAKFIGSNMSAFTDVEVGLDPNVREEYKKVRDEITVSVDAIKKAEQAIKLLKKLETADMLTDEKRDILEKSIRTKNFHDSKLLDLNDRKRELDEMLRQETTGRIKCTDIVYSGVKITIGSASMFVKEPLKYCLIYREGADIKYVPAR